MKLLSILLTAILCATASAQTIKTLGFNTTNGVVVASTGTNTLTFTNTVNLATIGATTGDLGIVADNVLIEGAIEFTGTNPSAYASTTRANLGFSTNLNALWTSTNASNARTAIGLGDTNNITFNSATASFMAVGGFVDNPATAFVADSGGMEEVHYGVEGIIYYSQYDVMSEINMFNQTLFGAVTNSPWIFFNPINFHYTNHAATTRTNLGLGHISTVDGGMSGFITTIFDGEEADNPVLEVGGQSGVSVFAPVSFSGANANTNKAITRTNLGLPLAALTNTSNVTMMRALSGSTNTNEPYSGSISVVGTNNTNTLVFSNGILQSVQ